MVPIKDSLCLIRKSSQCSGASRFPLSLSELSFTICLTLYLSVNKMCLVYCELNRFSIRSTVTISLAVFQLMVWVIFCVLQFTRF